MCRICDIDEMAGRCCRGADDVRSQHVSTDLESGAPAHRGRDGEPAIARILSHKLAREGHDVSVVARTSQALDEVAREPAR